MNRTGGAVRRELPGHSPRAIRLHFQHGPIDLLIGADGSEDVLAAAAACAWERFGEVLAELVAELPRLRRPIDPAQVIAGACPLAGPIARRMWLACAPFAGDEFVTPMAAVAGSVAQEIALAFDRPGIRRAWLNNGGDIAIVLESGAAVGIAVAIDRGGRVDAPHRLSIDAGSRVRGVATSGWRGRSLSRGIADSVTVLAASAAQADAAATIIANAVDDDDPRIGRAPADTVRDDSDLGRIAVTVAVPSLPLAVVQRALGRGVRRAQALIGRGMIVQALLSLQGETRVVGQRHGDPTTRPVEGRIACPV